MTLNAKNFSETLSANHLARSLEFCIDGLGFRVGDKFEQGGKVMGAMLEAGAAQLGISQDDFAKGRDREKGLAMGLYVETDQDLEALANTAKAAGINFEKELSPLPWGPMAFIGRDPESFKITVARPNKQKG